MTTASGPSAALVETLPADEFCAEFAVGSWDHGWGEEEADLSRLHGAYLDALSADVQARGVQHPVTVIDGVVMNGHHRVIACRRVGLPVPFVRTWQDCDYPGHPGYKWSRAKGSKAAER